MNILQSNKFVIDGVLSLFLQSVNLALKFPNTNVNANPQVLI